MTTQQIFDVFGLKTSAPVRVLKDDKEILEYIDFCVGVGKVFQDVVPKTEEWARIHFEGRCPYTDKECEKWTCTQCEVNAEESREYESLDDI